MSGFVLSLDVVDTFHSQAIIAIAEWGVRSIICLRNVVLDMPHLQGNCACRVRPGLAHNNLMTRRFGADRALT